MVVDGYTVFDATFFVVIFNPVFESCGRHFKDIVWAGIDCVAIIRLAHVIIAFTLAQAFFFNEDLYLAIVQNIYMVDIT